MRNLQLLQRGNRRCSQSNSTTQLGLFDLEQSKPRQLDLVVDRVPFNLSLADDRFYIRYGNWIAGIQLSRDEAYRAIGLCGRRRDPASIYAAIEFVVDGGAA